MPSSRLTLLLIFSLPAILLAGCQSMLMSKMQGPGYEEQLYVNAGQNFTIKHPLQWSSIQVPVSSPQYQPNRTAWTTTDPTAENDLSGTMQILTFPAGIKPAHERLNDFLATLDEKTTEQQVPAANDKETDLQYVGKSAVNGYLIAILKGKHSDYLVAFDFPVEQFDNILPVFKDVIDSFSEINPL